MQFAPYTGNRLLEVGIVIVYYFGSAIAFTSVYGELYWRDERFPPFLIEYLLQCPDRLADISRN